MRNYKKILLIAQIGILVGPVLVSAAVGSLPEPPLSDLSIEGIIDIMKRLVTWLFAILLILAVVYVILAAYVYLTSGGAPEGTKLATKRLIYAAVAIAVGLLSIGIEALVEQLVLGGSVTGLTPWR